MLSPSGPVFSSQCQQNRQTLGHKAKAANLHLFMWMTTTSAIARPDHLDKVDGGACRDRTDDPLLAKQVLSQLS